MAAFPTTARDRRIDTALWVLTGALALGTVVFSIVVSPPSTRRIPDADKLEHFLSYFATCLCLLLAAVWRPGRGDGVWPSGTLPIATAMIGGGVLIELLQGLTSTRQPQVSDAVADALGVALALLVHRFVRSRSHVGGRA